MLAAMVGARAHEPVRGRGVGARRRRARSRSARRLGRAKKGGAPIDAAARHVLRLGERRGPVLCRAARARGRGGRGRGGRGRGRGRAGPRRPSGRARRSAKAAPDAAAAPRALAGEAALVSAWAPEPTSTLDAQVLDEAARDPEP